MNLNVGCTSVYESNMFLRAFWALLRDNKKTGWQLWPKRIKNTMEIGIFPSPLLSCAYAISIEYKKRGCIDKILLMNPSGEDIPVDVEIVQKCVSQAKDYQKMVYEQWSYYLLDSPFGLLPHDYRSSNFFLSSYEEKWLLGFKVSGFDAVDIDSQSNLYVYQIIDFLSTQTSNSLYLKSKLKNYKIQYENKDNAYIKEPWLEYEDSAKGDSILLSNVAIDTLENIVKERVSYIQGLEEYIKASRLYNLACKNESFSYVTDFYPFSLVRYDLANVEIANLLFMSSFEVLANFLDIPAEKCDKCGQEKFNIRQKVLLLIEKYSDGYMSKQMIDSYYSTRSSYVHSGIFLGNRSYTGTSIPLLNDTGYEAQMPMLNIKILKEVGGYIFRKILNDIFAPKSSTID